MDGRKNYVPLVNEEDAKLFCNAKKDEQVAVIAFQSGVLVGRAIAEEKNREPK